MTRSVLATATLAPFAVGAPELAGVPVGYLITSTEAAGAVVNTAVPLDAPSATFTLAAGTWSSTIAPVDATGAAVGPSVADPVALVVTDVTVVTFNVPTALSLAVQA